MRKGSEQTVTAESAVAECDVIVTRTHEYFVAGAQCLAVRDRETGRFLRHHPVIGVSQVVSGNGLRCRAPSLESPKPLDGMPEIGEWLCLRRGDTLHYMGPVLAHEKRMPPVTRKLARASMSSR